MSSKSWTLSGGSRGRRGHAGNPWIAKVVRENFRQAPSLALAGAHVKLLALAAPATSGSKIE